MAPRRADGRPDGGSRTENGVLKGPILVFHDLCEDQLTDQLNRETVRVLCMNSGENKEKPGGISTSLSLM